MQEFIPGSVLKRTHILSMLLNVHNEEPPNTPVIYQWLYSVYVWLEHLHQAS